MNLNSMLNGQGAPPKRKNSSIHDMLNSGPPTKQIHRGPKRYAQPPIWAQSYRLRGLPAKPQTAAVAAPTSTQTTSKTGPGGVPSLLGLPPSFGSVVPADDLNRRICEWLYGHMHNMGEKRKYLEIEFKLGTACAKSNNKRLVLPVLSEVVLESTYVKNNIFFESGISHNHFTRIESLVGEYTSSQILEPLGDTRTRDQFHPTDGGAVVRVSLDEQDQLVAKITKQRVSDLIVHFPHEAVDLRISLSLEIPFEGSPQDVRAHNLVRLKNRSSWKTKGCQVDLTSVITDGRSQPTKEVELELDAEMLVQFFESFEQRSDSQAMDKFEELTRYGLDNCRMITRAISKAG